MQRVNNLFLDIKPAFAIITAVSISLFPVKFVIAWAFAALVHELFHIIAIRIMKIRILSITLDGTGSIIETEPMLPLQELICALSGPFGGLTVLFLAKFTPEAAVCALIQTTFNLLPYYPLDGGRALHSFAVILKGEQWGEYIAKFVNIVVISIVLGLIILLQVWYDLGILPVFMVFALFLRSIKSNYSLQSTHSNSTI